MFVELLCGGLFFGSNCAVWIFSAPTHIIPPHFILSRFFRAPLRLSLQYYDSSPPSHSPSVSLFRFGKQLIFAALGESSPTVTVRYYPGWRRMKIVVAQRNLFSMKNDICAETDISSTVDQQNFPCAEKWEQRSTTDSPASARPRFPPPPLLSVGRKQASARPPPWVRIRFT
jgi:hypothetical protein